MRTQEQRIMLMHKRAGEIKRKKEKITTVISGVCSSALMLFLVVFISFTDGGLHEIGDAGLAGNSMLADSVGGYVMVAVVAFAAAVLITLLCIRYKAWRGTGPDKDGDRSLNDRLNAMAQQGNETTQERGEENEYAKDNTEI